MAIDSIQFKQNNFFDHSKSTSRSVEVAANPYNRIQVISTSREFFAMRESWNSLNDESHKGTVFASWEWLYTWWEVYQKQGSRNLYILTCTDTQNNVLGIAPFQIVYNPKRYFPNNRQLIMIGTGETDGSNVFGEYMDLVIKPGHETAVLTALSQHLYANKNLWDGMKFHELLLGSHVSKLFSENTKSQHYYIEKAEIKYGFRTYIDLPETYKDYLMSLRKKMRNNITRTFSRLESEQEYKIREITTDSAIHDEMNGKPDAIKVLAELNRVRRNDLNKESVFAFEKFETFHRQLVKRLLPQNKVSLRFLEFDSEIVAALYSFIDKNTMHVYQSGFETNHGHRYSLLTTMLTQEISNSIERDDVSRFNFMYADDEQTYKRRYSGTTEPMYRISYEKQGLKTYIYRLIHIKLKGWVKKTMNIE